jgi:Domain of unknown function (DUF4259)
MLQASAMGTWGTGPFDNDAAADFLDALRASPTRFVAKTLREIAQTPARKYIDVDDGGAGWSACEMVALAFGYGDTAGLDDHILDLAGKLRPKEEHRLLALEVLPRIADRANSELAGLRHEGSDGAQFDAALEHLRSRLQAAGEGARELPRPKAGDVILLPSGPQSAELVVVQVVGPGEVAIFEGTSADEEAALECVKNRPARRAPTAANKLLRRGRKLGNVPLRKELRGKKYYASESGALEHYYLSTAGGGGLRSVSYEEARDYDVHCLLDEGSIRAVARGARPVERVRSLDEREAELRARNAKKWAARREATTAGPFGDVAVLEHLLQWIEQYGIDNAVQRFHDQAVGKQGYGRPREYEERRSYAFSGLVALWRGTWPPDVWPAELVGRLPPTPDNKLLRLALSAARILAARVLTRDAELRLMWDEAPDNGAELRKFVASLQSALAE